MGNISATYQYTKNVGTIAYIYGYAPVVQQVIMSQDIATKAPFNKLYYSSGLASPTYTPFYLPDTDSLYATAWLDLTNTPVILKTPNNTCKPIRYYTIQLLDMYGNTFYNAPGLKKNKQSKTYIIVGPNYEQYKLKSNCIHKNAKIIVSPTANVYLVSRTEIINNNISNASKFMHKIKLDAICSNASVLSVQSYDSSVLTTKQFYTILLNVIKYNPPPITELALLTLFKSIGLDPCLSNLDDLNNEVNDALNSAISSALYQIIPSGFLYSSGNVNSSNWSGNNQLGTYCQDYLKRAFINYQGPAANFSREQFYLNTTLDNTGATLNGSLHNYNIHFNKGSFPKTHKKGFWSITLYQISNNNLSFYSNEVNRYAVGSNKKDLIYNSDGSLDIFIRNSTPTIPIQLSNWLPAPLDTFKLFFRIYLPCENQLFHLDNIPSINVIV